MNFSNFSVQTWSQSCAPKYKNNAEACVEFFPVEYGWSDDNSDNDTKFKKEDTYMYDSDDGTNSNGYACCNAYRYRGYESYNDEYKYKSSDEEYDCYKLYGPKSKGLL